MRIRFLDWVSVILNSYFLGRCASDSIPDQNCAIELAEWIIQPIRQNHRDHEIVPVLG